MSCQPFGGFMHRAFRNACLTLACGLSTIAVFTPQTFAQRPTPIVAPGGTDADKARLAELRTAAMGEDRLASMKALDEIKAMKEIGRPTLVDTLKALLLRDRAAAEVAAKK